MMDHDKQPQTSRVSGAATRTHIRSLAVLAVAGVALAGCSSIPDAVNPVEWYKGTVDYFSTDDAPAEAKMPSSSTAGAPQSGDNKAFPKLSSVPARPKPGGLVADTSRRYAPTVSRQGDAPSAVASTQPPPPAMPSVPVTPVPMGQTAAPAPAVAHAMPKVLPRAMPRAMPRQTAQAPRLTPPAPAGQTGNVMDTYRNRLQEVLSAPRGAKPGAGLSGLPQVSSAARSGSEPLATVIISSDGVISEGVMNEPTGQIPLQESLRIPGAGTMAASSSGEVGQLKVATILFSNGTSKLTNRDIGILRDVIELLNERGGTLRIVGHASSRTRDLDMVRHKMVNFQLSVERANAVARSLIRLGLPAAKLSVTARSNDDPMFYEFMPAGEAGNRRAEIYIQS